MSRKQHEAGTASFGGFARILGERSPSYVTQLKGEGRLVLTEDGKRVRVQDSLALVRATADPSKSGVKARHAANRAIIGSDGVPVVPVDPLAAAEADDDGEVRDSSHANRRAKALADKEEELALTARRVNLIAAGDLLTASEVEAALVDAGTSMRTSLENLPNTLAPELAAERDEGRVRVILSEAIEHVLEEIARQFSNLAKPVGS